LNPSEELHEQKHQDLPTSKVEEMNEMAALIASSDLIKSYEQQLSEYQHRLERKENENERKNNEIKELQDQNNELVSKLETKLLEQQRLQTTKNIFAHDLHSTGESEKYVQLLQKNHDVVVEKYESYKVEYERVRREHEESLKLYTEMKIENDKLADQNYQYQRQKEDAVNAKRILESKLRTAEETLQVAQDERRQFKAKAEQAEAQ